MLYFLDNRGNINWVTEVKNILCSTKFGDVWFNQGKGDIDIFIEVFLYLD